MKNRIFELVGSLWREVLGGLIVAILVEVWGSIRSEVPTVVRLVGIGLSAAIVIGVSLRAARTRKALVYVSAGGTCRDPMAKAITDQLFAGRRLKYPVNVYAIGLQPAGEKKASYGAIHAIKELYKADLLKDHKPTGFTARLIREATLILVMDRALFKVTENTLPRSKTYVFKEFFGQDGDIADPYRESGEHDPKAEKRYEDCANELKQILSSNIDKLLQRLEAA